MCGRYYVDDETAREIERIIRIADEKVRSSAAADTAMLKTSSLLIEHNLALQAKDIHPTDIAPILTADGQGLCCRKQKWGFPGFDKKQVIFNARSESALEKPTFQEAMPKRRIVIPAAGFYEWNSRKEKNTFYRKNHSVLFMAGIYNPYGEEDCFVILTTAANPSMEPIHDRMPLLLEEEEILPWIFDRDASKDILKKIPYLLERKTDFEQLSLF